MLTIPKRVMIVEDDADFAESITMILESAGYRVESASGGEDCFALLKLNKPDLIIMDIMMNSLTEGFTIIYTLKSSEEYRSIPVIVVSAIVKHTGFAVDTDFLQIETYLEKPLSPQSLLDNVRRLTA